MLSIDKGISVNLVLLTVVLYSHPFFVIFYVSTSQVKRIRVIRSVSTSQVKCPIWGQELVSTNNGNLCSV